MNITELVERFLGEKHRIGFDGFCYVCKNPVTVLVDREMSANQDGCQLNNITI